MLERIRPVIPDESAEWPTGQMLVNTARTLVGLVVPPITGERRAESDTDDGIERTIGLHLYDHSDDALYPTVTLERKTHYRSHPDDTLTSISCRLALAFSNGFLLSSSPWAKQGARGTLWGESFRARVIVGDAPCTASISRPLRGVGLFGQRQW